MQTSPPLDECVFASTTRPILIHQTEESPLLASLTSQEIQAPQQDRASAESELVTPQEPSTSTMEQYPISGTPIHQVKPVLGMTPTENWQLQDRNQPQDIVDILGTAAYEGIETDVKHLKEATSCNVQNIQTSLGIQQTYSSTLCSHINNIYNKLSELQKHIQHHCMYPHQSNTVQIDTPEYDPDIDGDNPIQTKSMQQYPYRGH